MKVKKFECDLCEKSYRALLTGFWRKLFRVCPSNDPEPSVNIFSKYNVALNRASKSCQERPIQQIMH